MPDLALSPRPEAPSLKQLVAEGWTPPAHMLAPYRPLLGAFYRARSMDLVACSVEQGATLDNLDIVTILGLMGVLDYLDLDHPQPEPAANDES